MRVLLHAALLITALLAPGGRYLAVVASVVGVMSIALVLYRRARPLSLILAWEVGFLLLVAIEAISRYEEISRLIDGHSYAEAVRYLVAANSVVVIAHALVFRACRFGEVPRHRWVFRRQHTALFLVVVTALFWLFQLPRVLQVMESGRSALDTATPWISSTSVAPILHGFLGGAGMALPSLYVFAATRVFSGSLRWAVLASLPLLFAHFVVGTRFPMLFAVAGMVVVLWGSEPLHLRVWVRAALVTVVVMLAVSVMLEFRGQGFANADLSEVLSDLAANGLDTNEGVLLTQARLVDWYDRQPHLDGRSSVSVFVFWVPRPLWASKPTLLEYWFPRAYGLRGIPANHSIAAGFGADGYADGGFAGGLVVAGLLGLLLAAVDRATSSVLVDRGSPYLVMVGPLFGASFFAVRSHNTALIASSGVVFLAWLFRHAVGGRRLPLEELPREPPG